MAGVADAACAGGAAVCPADDGVFGGCGGCGARGIFAVLAASGEEPRSGGVAVYLRSDGGFGWAAQCGGDGNGAEGIVGGERPAWFDARTGEEERRETTEKALRQLSEEQRAVVVLKIWGGLTLEQAAAALSEPMGTVASRYRRALEKMARVLRPEVCDG